MGRGMEIHVFQEGQQFGPFSKAQLESYLWEGNVQRSDLAWVEGQEDWLPLWQVLGMAPLPGELPEPEVAEEVAAEEEADPVEAEPAEIPQVVEEVVVVVEVPTATLETPPVVEQEETPTTAEDAPVPEAPPAPATHPRLILPPAAPKRKLKL